LVPIRRQHAAVLGYVMDSIVPDESPPSNFRRLGAKDGTVDQKFIPGRMSFISDELIFPFDRFPKLAKKVAPKAFST
jgi:hypothetical protein